MSKFKVGDTAWVKVVLEECGNNNYPLEARSEDGGYFGIFTPEGKFNITDERQTLFTEDEAREILGVKPKDEMRYFHVHFFTKDVNDVIRHLSLCVTSQGMFSRRSLYAYISNDLDEDLKSAISFIQIISWQELTKDDYEAFTA